MEYAPGSRPDIFRSEPDPARIARLREVADPKLTIITVSLNLGRFLEDTIRSVLNQSFDDFEHVVVDGGSTDGTLEILERYPHIRWISEKDSGYPDGFRKGLAMARGKYLMQCAVSDAYANRNWFRYCVETLDRRPEISLVWGLPQYLSEEGVAGGVSFPQFHRRPAPEKSGFFNYWLRTGFFCPEGNLCVRKAIVQECYPSDDDNMDRVDWNMFGDTFNTKGYQSCFLPVAANFGRTHDGQLGQDMKKSGKLAEYEKNHRSYVTVFRKRLLSGSGDVRFVDGQGNETGERFNRMTFLAQGLVDSINELPRGIVSFLRPLGAAVLRRASRLLRPKKTEISGEI